MEILIFIVLLVIIAILISGLNKLNEKLTSLQRNVSQIKTDLAYFQEKQLKDQKVKSSSEGHVTVAEPAKIIIPEPDSIPVAEVAPEPVFAVAEEPALAKPFKAPEKPKKITKPAIDWEKFIGENLINKIGIAILTIGIGIFIKFAIDQHWINEIGRVLIGLLAGGILLGVAHKLRQEYKAFSSVLVGGGITVLYFSVGIAFHEYHLLGQTAAFICMLFITAFAVFFSLAYNRIELAVIALIGGFATPFMVSTGSGNYAVLFSYLIILNIGMLVLAGVRKWNLIYIVSCFFTILLFGSWLVMEYKETQMAGALVFATAFYLIFFAAASIFNIRNKKPFAPLDYIIILSLNLSYFSAGIYILNQLPNLNLKGLFTAIVGCINLAFAFFLYKKNTDRNFIFLLIGLVMTYATLAAPIQLNGNQITLFWAAESVLLLWLAKKSGIALIRKGSVLLWVPTLISLLMDWNNVYSSNSEQMMPVLNQGFLTTIFCIAAFVLNMKLLSGEKTKNFFFDGDGIETDSLSKIALGMAVAVGFTGGIVELNEQIISYTGNVELDRLSIFIYVVLFVNVTNVFAYKKGFFIVHQICLYLLIPLMLVHITVVDSSIAVLRNNYLFGPASIAGFALHIGAIAAMVWSVLLLLKYLVPLVPQLLWALVTYGVWAISLETNHITISILADNINETSSVLKLSHRAAYPIIWGICSFILMIAGMQKRNRLLRIISLSLFGVTLLKLFILDIRGISAGGKIAAFISLGVLLLVVSFLYQRLKKLIIDEKVEENVLD